MSWRLDLGRFSRRNQHEGEGQTHEFGWAMLAALRVQGPGLPIYPLSPVSFPQMRQEKAVATGQVSEGGQRVGCDAARRCESNSSAPHAPNRVCEAFSAAESEVAARRGLVSVKWDVGGGDGGGEG